MPDRNIVEYNSLTINPEYHLVTYDNIKNDRLPLKEFNLLLTLASKPGAYFKRSQLINEVWTSEVCVLERTVDVHVAKLRSKFGKDFIESIKGVGYRLNPNIK